MHTAVTVAANSLDAHESPGRQSLEDAGCCPGPGASVRGSLGCCVGPGASVRGSLGCGPGPGASSGAALDAVWGLAHRLGSGVPSGASGAQG